MEELITTAGVARICGVAPDTVRLWERTGKLAATRTESGIRLFRREDVEREAARRAAVASTSAAK